VVAKELKKVGETLDSIITRKDLMQFLNNVENAGKLNGLVEDIRDALMGYQVCIPEPLACITSNDSPDLVTASYL
jgi:hypothetical protein